MFTQSRVASGSSADRVATARVAVIEGGFAASTPIPKQFAAELENADLYIEADFFNGRIARGQGGELVTGGCLGAAPGATRHCKTARHQAKRQARCAPARQA